MLTRDSVLHYWDAMYGIAPVVGGDASFTRDSAAWVRDRQGILRQLIRGFPRFGWGTLDGERRPLLELEPARTNIYPTSSALVGSGAAIPTANAGVAPNGTVTATRYDGMDGAAGERIGFSLLNGQSISGRTFTGAVWLRGEGTNIGKTVGVQMKRVAGTTANTPLLTVTLTDQWQRVSPGSFTGLTDNTGITFTFQRGSANYAASVLAWGLQIEEAAYPTSDIPTAGASATRAVDQCSWGAPPPPQATVTYLRFVNGIDSAAWGVAAGVLSILGQSSGSREIMYHNAATRVSVALWNGSVGTTADATFPAAIPVAADLEMGHVVEADGSHRLIARADGGAPVVATAAAPTGGLPAIWGAQTMPLGAYPDGTSASAHNYATRAIVKRADLTADPVADPAGVLDELRNLVLSPAGDLI